MKTGERKLGQNSVWEVKWHSCHFSLISKNRAARLIVSLGCGQLSVKFDYFYVSWFFYLDFIFSCASQELCVQDMNKSPRVLIRNTWARMLKNWD